jgi:hypothetical protein
VILIPNLKAWILRAIAACLAMLMLLGVTASLLAQEEKKAESAKKAKEKEKAAPVDVKWKPAIVPAEALAFGAQLEEAASQELKEWVWDYIKKSLRDRPIDPKAVIGAVDTRYAAASDLARDAGIYLLYFLAYKDDDENQRMLSYRIRDIDRETYDISRELAILLETEQNRMAATRRPITFEERVRREEQEQKLNARLRELGDERQLKATQVAFSRKKVDIYLKLMSYAYERMKGTDPGVMRELK